MEGKGVRVRQHACQPADVALVALNPTKSEQASCWPSEMAAAAFSTSPHTCHDLAGKAVVLPILLLHGQRRHQDCLRRTLS